MDDRSKSMNIMYCEQCDLTGQNTEQYPQISKEFARGYLDIYYLGPGDACPFCKSQLIDSGISHYDFNVIGAVSNYNRQLLKAVIELNKKDLIEYEFKMTEFRIRYEQDKQQKEQESSNLPKCPTCGSKNIKKIGEFERVSSVAMLGAYSKKFNKSYKCVNCGYTW